ncbi:MAG: SMI1/KNR4 family protein [Reyranella sp.]|uniref:SMI1/KNR4 family protein n=1 Tax=Reyranella sp. TaxID=1929291 RepID=UPI0026007B6E|nr:SMI1/KNR4 family protein [Reyranella sp.]MBR2813899.1 SMI1/KNR4 family protein [Reyranella sp.]
MSESNMGVRAGDDRQSLPEPIRRFIEKAIVVGDMGLPFHYPTLAGFDGWQTGFRRHGVTGESLVAVEPGKWQPGWHVIALNGFDDPFFVDFREETSGFPVYYAPHGAGRWVVEQVAPDIHRFIETLSSLRDLTDDDAEALLYIDVHVGFASALWREVYEARRDRKDVEPERAGEETPPDPDLFRFGTLVVTDIGPRKLEVVRLLRGELGQSLQDTLKLAGQGEIVVASGRLAHLRRSRDRLAGLGAIVEFRPVEPEAGTQ